MKLLALVLALATVPAISADSVLGHVRMDGNEIEVYNRGGWCNEKTEGLDASIYPMGERDKYKMGCWRPLFTDQILINFRDGSQLIFYRKQLMRADQESKISL